MPEYQESDLMSTAQVYEHLGVYKEQFRQYTENPQVKKACGARKISGKGHAIWWPPDGVALLAHIAEEDKAGIIDPGNIEVHLERLQRLETGSMSQIPLSLGNGTAKGEMAQIPPRGVEIMGELIPIGNTLVELIRHAADTPALLPVMQQVADGVQSIQGDLDRIAAALETQAGNRLLTQKQAREEFGITPSRFHRLRGKRLIDGRALVKLSEIQAFVRDA